MISSIVTMVALAVAANLDNAGVGIAYGVRQIQISHLANFLVAVISGVATIISGVVGSVMVHYVHPVVANTIGAIVMFGVGLWVLLEPVRERRKANRAHKTEHQAGVITRILEDPVVADFDASKTISLTEAAVLGVALAMNAFAGGFDAGVTHINVWWTGLSVAVFSYLLLGVSAYFGRHYAARALGTKATFIAGLLLIAIGIHQLW